MADTNTAPSRAQKTFAVALVPVVLIALSLIVLRGPAAAWSVGGSWSSSVSPRQPASSTGRMGGERRSPHR